MVHNVTNLILFVSQITSTLTLLKLYEGMVRATIFLETMQEDVSNDQSLRTSKEEHMTHALSILSHGGQSGNRQNGGGIYQMLCKLYTYLAANGHFADASHLSRNSMPQHMVSPPSRADRHNRDYVVLRNVRRLLDHIKTVLQGMHHSGKRHNIKYG